MGRTRCFLPVVAAFLAGFVSSRAALPAGETPSPGEVLDMLFAHDAEFFAAFSLRIQAAIQPPVMAVGSGGYRAELRLTGDSDGRYLKLTTVEFDKPTYFPPPEGLTKMMRTSPDHDREGNLIVWRPRNQYMALNKNGGIIRYDSESIRVAPNAEIVSTVPGKPLIEKYPGNADDSNNLLFRYLLALGRGYSHLISRIDRVRAGPGGTLLVEGQGALFSPHAGKWELTVDPQNQYLVKKAVFTPEKGTTGQVVCESEGSFGDWMPLAKSGSSFLGGLKISIADYDRKFDQTLREEVLTKVSVRPPQSWIIDHNVVSSDGTPLVVSYDNPYPQELPALDESEPPTGTGDQPTPREDTAPASGPSAGGVPGPLSGLGARAAAFLTAGACMLAAIAFLAVIAKRRHKLSG